MITVLFVLLVYVAPTHNYHVWFVTYPANTNALVSLVSFSVSGIYLAFLLTVIAATVARGRGWVAEGSFTLGKWGWPVIILAIAYLGADAGQRGIPDRAEPARAPTSTSTGSRSSVIAIIAIVGAIYFLIGRPDKPLRTHLHDELEPTGAERAEHEGADRDGGPARPALAGTVPGCT